MPVSNFRIRVLGVGFLVSGFGFRVSGFGFRVDGFGSRLRGRFGISGSHLDGTPPTRAAKPFRVSGSRFRVPKIGFTVSGIKFGLRVHGLKGRVEGSRFESGGFTVHGLRVCGGVRGAGMGPISTARSMRAFMPGIDDSTPSSPKRFRLSGSRFRVQTIGFTVLSTKKWVHGFEYNSSGSRFRA